MKRSTGILSLLVMAALGLAPSTQPATRATDAPALRFTLKGVDDQDLDLIKYHGRVVMVVPVAWDANRRQFEDLERLDRFLRDRSAVLIAVLTDSFGAEGRSDEELVKAINDRYSTGLLFAGRTAVKGEGAAPLFKYFAALPGELGGEVKGPFTKFLISRDGEVVRRWEPAVRLVEEAQFREVYEVINTPMK